MHKIVHSTTTFIVDRSSGMTLALIFKQNIRYLPKFEYTVRRKIFDTIDQQI